ncbi:MAG: long-chain-fatty-acid--CoA ligase [Rhizobiaceae bacterium]|nr:long-chain-fatty-acid--CoA ligase [Rhizobiaceae bacterium]
MMQTPAMQARPWLASYPPMVPQAMPPLTHASLAALLVDACERFAARSAFSCMGKALSFAEILASSRALAAHLQSRGLKKGARVALMMPNILQYPVALLAVLRAGCTIVNVNPLYTPRELEHQLRDSGAEAIIILENFAHTLQQVQGKTPVKHVIVASMGDLMGMKGHIVNFVVRKVKKLVPAWDLPGHISFNAALRAGGQAQFSPVETGLNDIAFLQYTGGTTGVSKGAALSNSNILSNAVQTEAWLKAARIDADNPEPLTFMCPLPLYHIFALTVNLVMGMRLGAMNVLIPNPRDIPAFVAEMAKHRFNVFPGLNTLFNALASNPDFAKCDFSGLKLTFGGGMAVQRPIAEKWRAVTGCAIHEGYGLSETSPVATANRFDVPEYTGTIGLPIPGTDVAIRDEDGTTDMPLGEVGEICIRGPQVMTGYWQRPEETAKVMTSDGFFRSGDMGMMDARGFVKIVDRKKNMILVSGFNVYPNEVEEVAATHPGVLESAAIGVPDAHSGEAVKLYVVRKDPALTEDEIKAHLRKSLTAYKCPKYIAFKDALPKTNVGKILHRELRDADPMVIAAKG